MNDVNVYRLIAGYLSQDYKLVEYTDHFISLQKPNSTDILVINLRDKIIGKK